MGQVLQDLVQCCGWKSVAPTPVRVQVKREAPAAAPAPERSAPAGFAELEAANDELAAAEREWANASETFLANRCDETAARLEVAQLNMARAGLEVCSALRKAGLLPPFHR